MESEPVRIETLWTRMRGESGSCEMDCESPLNPAPSVTNSFSVDLKEE